MMGALENHSAGHLYNPFFLTCVPNMTECHVVGFPLRVLIHIDGTLVNTEYFIVSFGQSADINKIVAIMLKGPINLFKQQDLLLQQSRQEEATF